MIKIPPLSHAARRLHHSPARNRYGNNLPSGSMKVINVRKSGKAQAGNKRGQREQDAARKRSVANTEDVEPGKDHLVSLERQRWRQCTPFTGATRTSNRRRL